MKYYFIVYECTRYGWNHLGVSTGSSLIKSQTMAHFHPIEWQIQCNAKYGVEHQVEGGNKAREHYLVLNWIEVSRTEFINYKDKIG